MRWKVRHRTAALLSGAVSRICPKQHVAFLCSFYLAFSLRVSLGGPTIYYSILFAKIFANIVL